MSAETEVVVDTEVGEVRKKYPSTGTVLKLAREAFILRLLADSPHVPALKDVDHRERVITTEYVPGRSFADVFSVDNEWNASAKDWSEAGPLLAQYIAAEQSLLDEGIMYRDLSPGHLIFTGDRAVLVNHTESLVNKNVKVKQWYLFDHHGAEATMAPEEFHGMQSLLTPRTATYRSAVMAHVALGGGLPFEPSPPYWRKRRILQIAHTLPDLTREAFRGALDARPELRHADPAAFLNALTASYEDTV